MKAKKSTASLDTKVKSAVPVQKHCAEKHPFSKSKDKNVQVKNLTLVLEEVEVGKQKEPGNSN